jgi:chromosome segregation protein
MVKSTSGEGNVFAMTSIPNDGSSDEANGKANFESDPKISALTSSIAKLEQELKAAREMTADAKAKDSVEQKASDEAMEKIKDMEDRAIYIKGTLIVQEQQRIKELKASNEDLQLQIAKGSGMTVDQEREKSNLTAAYEQSQKEAAEVNVRMSQLRASLVETEQKLELAVKTRDKLNSELDGIEQDVLIAKEQVVAKKLSVDAAERNQSLLQASLEQSRSEFHDLNKLLDEAKEVADVTAAERANICEKASKASQELADLLKSNEATINELEAIKKENDEIRCTNDTMLKTLEMKQQEHQNILEQRSKMAKLIQLINQKSENTEQERKALEKEKKSVHLDIVALETELPMAAKANESMKRVIKRLSTELEMINRKADIARRGCKVADDLLQLHQSTLTTQKNEITGE